VSKEADLQGKSQLGGKESEVSSRSFLADLHLRIRYTIGVVPACEQQHWMLQLKVICPCLKTIKFLSKERE
jgi:hypothetical protein